MYQRLVYDNNWITTLSAGPNQHVGPQLFTLWFQVQAGAEARRVVAAVIEELEWFRENLPPAGELAKARNQVFYRFVSSRNTVSRVGEILAKYAVLYEDASLINEDVNRYLEVTPQMVLEAAQRTFHPENQTMIFVEPSTSNR